MRLWDYRGLLWNLDGIICFCSVMSFTVIGLVFHYLLEPAAVQMVRKMSPKIVWGTCLTLSLKI
ncbi:putative ABC transporter permease [Anaerostipes sp.]|uniref:putative ABC transporter permease n=1 Tax=Anaerostipes sp. TaxID=1872530 RepID=UPI003FA479F5